MRLTAKSLQFKRTVPLGLAALFVSFFIWKLMAPVAFLPIMSGVTESFISRVHSEVDAKFYYSEKYGQWVIETGLFKPRKSWTNNTYLPKLSISGKTTIPTANALSYTLGLPLFWAFIVLISKHRLNHVTTGSLVILITALLAYVAAVHYSVISAISQESGLRVYTSGGYIITPNQTHPFLVIISKTVADVLGVLSTLVAPALICYFVYSSQTQLDQQDNC